jgi:hypothetical protein
LLAEPAADFDPAAEASQPDNRHAFVLNILHLLHLIGETWMGNARSGGGLLDSGLSAAAPSFINKPHDLVDMN